MVIFLILPHFEDVQGLLSVLNNESPKKNYNWNVGCNWKKVSINTFDNTKGINRYDLFKERENALESQTSSIEGSKLYQDMIGRENIELIGKLRKISKTRIEEICEFTEIGDALKRKVSGYSMCMKQRLGLGIAIMSKPKFLILDEPTNGLDPTGKTYPKAS